MKFMVKGILDNFKDGQVFDFDDSEILILTPKENRPETRICKSQRDDSEFEVMMLNGRLNITCNSSNVIYIAQEGRIKP